MSRTALIAAAVVALLALVPAGVAQAQSCVVLPFSKASGVTDGAALNVTSLVSAELDIHGEWMLVLAAEAAEVPAGCARDTSCVRTLAKKGDHGHAVTGTIAEAGPEQYALTATLIEVKSGRTVRSVDAKVDRKPGLLI